MGELPSNLASKQIITVWMFNERKRVEGYQLLWCTPNFQLRNRRISFQNRELFPLVWRTTFLFQLGVKLISPGETNFVFVKTNFGESSQDCDKTGKFQEGTRTPLRNSHFERVQAFVLQLSYSFTKESSSKEILVSFR